MRRSEAIFDIAARKVRIREIDARMSVPGFWHDQEQAQVVVAESRQLKSWVEPFIELDAKAASLTEMRELLHGGEEHRA